MAAPSSLFNSVCFFLQEENVDNKSEVLQALRRGGGMRDYFMSHLVTHIITDAPLERLTQEGNCQSAAIVNSNWVLLSDKHGTLLPTSLFDMTGSKLLTGLVLCPTQVSQSDRKKLWVMISYYGGKYQGQLDASVTHLLAIEAGGIKHDEALKHGIKVVTPAWLLDSIKEGELQPEERYPPLVATTTGRNMSASSVEISLIQDKGAEKREGVTTRKRKREEEGSGNKNNIKEDVTERGKGGNKNEEEVEHPIIKKQHVVDTHQEKVATEIPKTAPITRIDSLTESIIEEPLPSRDHLLLRQPVHRSSPALSEGVSPTPQPTPPQGRTGEEGEGKKERRLLEGITFGIVDYPELMGPETVKKWEEAITAHGGILLLDYDAEQCTHLLAQNKTNPIYIKAFKDGKCVSSAHWLNDVLSQQKMFPPFDPLHFPLAYQKPPTWCDKMSMTLTNYTGKERETVRDMINISGINYTSHLSHSTTHLIAKTSEGRKHEKALQWNIKVLNSTFVAEIMHGGVLPIIKAKHTTLGLKNEFRPTSHEAVEILRPWRSFITTYTAEHRELVDTDTCDMCFNDLPTAESEEAEMHQLLEGERKGEESEEGDRACVVVREEGEPIELVCKPRKGSRPPSVLFTGLSNVLVKKYRQYIVRLGGTIANDTGDCSHLIAPRIARTVKFLCAISISQYIVSTNWIDDSIKSGYLLDAGPYLLRDEEGEELFNMTVPLSLSRARDNKLLSGLCFYCTHNVMPPFESLNKIVESAGGELLTDAKLNRRYGKDLQDLPPNHNLIVITCPEDIPTQCPRFTSHPHPVQLFNAEFILTGILRQSLSYDQNQMLVEAAPISVKVHESEQ